VSLTDVELDRLADYTVDALDPREAAEVGRLIRTDARWAEAYRDLVGADALIQAPPAAGGHPAAMPPTWRLGSTLPCRRGTPGPPWCPLAAARPAAPARHRIAAVAAGVVAIARRPQPLRSDVPAERPPRGRAPSAGRRGRSSNLAAPSATPLAVGPRTLALGHRLPARNAGRARAAITTCAGADTRPRPLAPRPPRPRRTPRTRWRARCRSRWMP
jgi:hypothetical protein